MSGKIGFDKDYYIAKQSEQIQNRINQFGGKLYLEFGGKLFDDYHASRVLPGFSPDIKVQMLKNIADKVEIVMVISSFDIEKNLETITNTKGIKTSLISEITYILIFVNAFFRNVLFIHVRRSQFSHVISSSSPA